MLEYWVWLENTKSLKKKEKANLLETMKNVKDLYKLVSGDSIWGSICEEELKRAKVICQECESAGITIITRESSNYKKCDHFALYVKGHMSHGKSLAILGTRCPTSEGAENAGDFCKEYLKDGFQIHSGPAQGIERIISEKARAIGHPVYHFSHKSIFESDVTSEQAITVSPFAQKSPNPRYAYVIRNMLLVDWTDSFLLIEGSKESGSYKIAKMALEKGKEVKVVMPLIQRPAYEGNLDLFDMGADSVESVMVQKARALTNSKRAILDQVKKHSLNPEAFLAKATDKAQMRLDLLELEIEGFI